ncbi:hypothetical protein MKW98_017463 [Papaver atlanticum]|uniref:Uncharacterized protein n=1 Tax=Papaver atlanticum TaxID=357466 RepID=A0AAD4TB26_9MAGN|nr:hypothetical protein MKW98_017463 [Papaver atlanticum]
MRLWNQRREETGKLSRGVSSAKHSINIQGLESCSSSGQGQHMEDIEQRFIVPEHYQDYYFSKMGAYLKESRSRKAGLVLEALDQLQGEEREKMLAKLMPTSMSVNEWETFVKHVGSVEFRSKGSKCKKYGQSITSLI